jgi:predicted DNA-binding antitoxin AbrB/MazE fold protein
MKGNIIDGSMQVNIPQNIINSLYALWENEEVEWGGGLDFESDPIPLERVSLISGSSRSVSIKDMEDYEILFHFHPKTKDERHNTLNETFSLADFSYTFNLFDAHPELKKKAFINHILIGSTGKLWLMTFPTKIYEPMKKEGVKMAKDEIKQFRSEIPKREDINESTKKRLLNLSDWELFLHINEDGIDTQITKTTCEELGYEFDSLESKCNIPKEQKLLFFETYNKNFGKFLKSSFEVEIKELKPPYTVTLDMIGSQKTE